MPLMTAILRVCASLLMLVFAYMIYVLGLSYGTGNVVLFYGAILAVVTGALLLLPIGPASRWRSIGGWIVFVAALVYFVVMTGIFG